MTIPVTPKMSMKTEDGERLVRRGEVVLFPVGPAGAHGFRNDGDVPVRMLNIHAPAGFDRRIGLRD